MEQIDESVEDLTMDVDYEIEEINSNIATFRKYPELSDDKWPKDY